MPGPKEQIQPALMAVLVSSLVRPTMGPAFTASLMKTYAWTHMASTVGITIAQSMGLLAISR